MTVEVPDITKPATFARIADALAAAWQSLQPLSLTKIERRWLECMLTSPEAKLVAAESFERFGEWVMPFQIGGVSHELRMRPVSAVAAVGAGKEVQPSHDGRATSPDPR
ncbi:hypothetical protein ACIGXM_32620 [Kitasatospora sp. NPDC052896]|uniref:hypothetical protein n=1 Tax=Kitasatospora sp. NPDC052896 TaxID=3364061 RepID=UPI0037CB676B